MVSKALSELYQVYNERSSGELAMQQLAELYNRIRIGGISLTQVVASMECVCGNSDYVMLDELKDVLEEMDRRYYLIQDLQWEFALLDNEHTGVISVEKARFLFQTVHGSLFSHSKWKRFLKQRILCDAPLSFSEIEVDLCNVPSPADWNFEDVESDKLHKKYAQELEEIWRRKEEAKKRTEQKKREMEEKRKIEEKQRREAAERLALMALQEKRAEEERSRAKSSLHEKSETIEKTASTSIEDEGMNLRAMEVEAERRRRKAEEEEEKKRMEETKKMEEERKRKEEKREKKKKEKKEAKKRERASQHQKYYNNLEKAVESEDREVLEPAIKEYRVNVPERDHDELLSEAERLLEKLKCSAALSSAMANRVIADLESAIARSRKSGFDRSEADLANETSAADDLLLRLRRLEKLRSEVLELKQSTIAELRSYHNPLPVIHRVMIATYLLLGVAEKETKKWPNVQILLGRTGKEGLKRRISQCNVLNIDFSTAKRARVIMGEVDLEAIRDVSAGAATFFVWAEGMIEEVVNIT